MSKLSDQIFNIYAEHEKASVLVSVKRAFSFLVPVFMIGACTLTIQNFPVPVIRDFVHTALNGHINEFLDVIYNATFGLSAVYLLVTLSYYMALSMAVHNDIRIFSTISSLVCYFAFLGPDVFAGRAELMEYTKMTNIFSALIISLAATYLFYWLYGLTNRRNISSSTVFMRGMHSIFPMLCCLLIFTAIADIICIVPGISNFNDLITLIISKPFESMGATYLSGLLIMMLESVLWLLGIHGGNVFDDLLTSQTNAFALSGGQIMTKPFTDTFALMGGCGTAVCLLIAILLFTKEHKKRKLCRLAAVPMIFNINEILIFGLPVVLNPIYVIPFILTPMVSYTIAYAATALELVPHIINTDVQWTTPIIISGFQATGSIAGSILQLVLLLVGVAIYAPFVILDNRIARENEVKYINHLTDICRECEAEGRAYSLDNESLTFRSFEDDIAEKLYTDILKDTIHMQYQPQVEDGLIVSAEALLRFRYAAGDRFMYPPLVVAIAEKNRLFESMSKAVVKKSLADLHRLQAVSSNFKIAVNLNLELLTDDDFRHWLIKEVSTFNISAHTFGVEITENANMSDAIDYSTAFNEIREAGIEILMDDFSMGHTSIAFLQKNYFDYVKIDGNLIKALSNERSQSIVSSIVNLGRELNFKVIAEFVETEKQKEKLLDMGCGIFQGYLYYRDMPVDELAVLLKEQTN